MPKLKVEVKVNAGRARCAHTFRMFCTFRERYFLITLTLSLLLSGCALTHGPGGHTDAAPQPAEHAQRLTPAEIETLCTPPEAQRAPPDGAQTGVPGAPEIATGYRSRSVVHTHSFMVVAANPLAAQAACRVLAQGGAAVDAAIAGQMVLNLVEPQSSGIGGGGFLLHYDAARGQVDAYDGRETAPAAADAYYLSRIGPDDPRPPLPDARASGRSVGTPGLLHMLDRAHRDHGRLAWASLFEPAISLAREGFHISPRMAASVAASRDALARNPRAAAYFLDVSGTPRAAGTLLRSPALAHTFETLAQQGIEPFYEGTIARDIVDSVRNMPAPQAVGTAGADITPGRLTLTDLAGYRSQKRDALCTPYRAYRICGMPPPSSGGITVAAALGILSHFDLAVHAPQAPSQDGGLPTAAGIHLITEAQRLAYADRNRYLADTDFVPLPGGPGADTALLDPHYLQRRAALIDTGRSMGQARPGEFAQALAWGELDTPETGTTHVSIVDRSGNVLVMTSSIEGAFGSYLMTEGGFLLNNQLTDFAVEPVDAEGRLVANRVQPGKRPRSSMAPTLVFGAQPAAQGDDREAGAGALEPMGHFVMATGSPGGAAIIQYVIKALVGTLDWGLDAQQAASLLSFGAGNGPTTFIGGEHPALAAGRQAASRTDGAALLHALEARGHVLSLRSHASGLGNIVRTVTPDGRVRLSGGADPRREGVVLGDVSGNEVLGNEVVGTVPAGH